MLRQQDSHTGSAPRPTATPLASYQPAPLPPEASPPVRRTSPRSSSACHSSTSRSARTVGVRLAVFGEDGTHHVDDRLVDAGHGGGHRIPNPARDHAAHHLVGASPQCEARPLVHGRRDQTLNRRSVSRSASSSRSAKSAMSASVVVPSTLTTAAATSAESRRSRAPATALDIWCSAAMRAQQTPDAGITRDTLRRHGFRRGGQQHESGQESFRPTAFEGQLRGHLTPTLSDLAEHHGVRHEGAVEDHLVEMVRTVHRDDRADVDSGAAQVDDELTESGVPVLGIHRTSAASTMNAGVVGADVHTFGAVTDQPPSTRSA